MCIRDRRLGGIFFSNLADMTKEFHIRAFPNSPAAASGKCAYIEYFE